MDLAVGSFFWFPVVGVRRTTAMVPEPARIAGGDPRFGGFFFGVQPSSWGPLGRMVERSPGGSSFAGPGITCDFTGKRRGARGKRPVLSAFSRPAGMLVFGGVLLAPERAFPKTGQVINLAGLTGREADFPNASPEAGSGEFQKGRRPFRVPGRAATTEKQ